MCRSRDRIARESRVRRTEAGSALAREAVYGSSLLHTREGPKRLDLGPTEFEPLQRQSSALACKRHLPAQIRARPCIRVGTRTTDEPNHKRPHNP